MSHFLRKSEIRRPRKIIRIFTEGVKTEPNYFNSIKNELRLSEIDIKVNGRGDHTLPLVQWVIERKNEERSDIFETEWWVVFDRDDHSDFNHCIELAEANGIHAAYSNECFELWFILHFEFLQTSLGRERFDAKLTKLLGRKYGKNDSDIYGLIKQKETDAIRNAKNLEKMHDTAGTQPPARRDPSSLVYKLVENLRSLKDERKVSP